MPHVVGFLGALQLQQRGHGLGAMHAQHVVAIRRQRQRGDDADHRQYDQEFEQCDAALKHAATSTWNA